MSGSGLSLYVGVGEPVAPRRGGTVRAAQTSPVTRDLPGRDAGGVGQHALAGAHDPPEAMVTDQGAPGREPADGRRADGEHLSGLRDVEPGGALGKRAVLRPAPR